MKTTKTVWKIISLSVLVATVPQDIRMALATFVSSALWSDLWPYLVVYLTALAGYLAQPDLARTLGVLARRRYPHGRSQIAK